MRNGFATYLTLTSLGLMTGWWLATVYPTQPQRSPLAQQQVAVSSINPGAISPLSEPAEQSLLLLQQLLKTIGELEDEEKPSFLETISELADVGEFIAMAIGLVVLKERDNSTGLPPLPEKGLYYLVQDIDTKLASLLTAGTDNQLTQAIQNLTNIVSGLSATIDTSSQLLANVAQNVEAQSGHLATLTTQMTEAQTTLVTLTTSSATLNAVATVIDTTTTAHTATLSSLTTTAQTTKTNTDTLKDWVSYKAGQAEMTEEFATVRSMLAVKAGHAEMLSHFTTVETKLSALEAASPKALKAIRALSALIGKIPKNLACEQLYYWEEAFCKLHNSCAEDPQPPPPSCGCLSSTTPTQIKCRSGLISVGDVWSEFPFSMDFKQLQMACRC